MRHLMVNKNTMHVFTPAMLLAMWRQLRENVKDSPEEVNPWIEACDTEYFVQTGEDIVAAHRRTPLTSA